MVLSEVIMSAVVEFDKITEVVGSKCFNQFGIPVELKQINSWLCWSLVKTSKSKGDKPQKRPVLPAHWLEFGIRLAKWKDKAHQMSFEDAYELYENNENIHGIGFVPSPENEIIVIDYDRCLSADKTPMLGDKRTKHIQQLCKESFTEVTVSGKGLHVYLKGKLPTGRKNKGSTIGVELYPGLSQGFIATTGEVFDDSPLVLADGATTIVKHLQEFFGETGQANDKPAYSIPDSLGEGNRNSGMTQICGWLYSQGMQKSDILTYLLKYNEFKVVPPLSETEVLAIHKSISKAQEAKDAVKEQELQSYLNDIYHIRTHAMWFDFKGHVLVSAESLNTTYYNKEFKGKKDSLPLISNWLKAQANFKSAENVSWLPVPYGTEQRIIQSDNGATMVNTWRGFAVEPKEGNVQPWLGHLAHVVPEEDYRSALLWWIAYTIQHPNKKVSWQPIVLGISGAGKDALFMPIAKILGRAYKSIGNKDIKGDYDDGLWQTKLLHISEASGLKGSTIDFYKRITAPESDSMMLLNIKGQKKVEQPNICNVLVITNNLDAMKFDITERRAFILHAPTVMTEEQKTKYFEEWMHIGGAEALFHYLLQYPLTDHTPTKLPFLTTHFYEMFDMTRDKDESSIKYDWEDSKGLFKHDFVQFRTLSEQYPDLSKAKLKQALELFGFVKVDTLVTKVQKTIANEKVYKARDWWVVKTHPCLKSVEYFDAIDAVEKLVAKEQINRKF